MLKHTQLTRDRIRQFIQHDLREKLVTESHPVSAKLLIGDPADEVTARKAKSWKAIEPGFKWGPAYQMGWYWVSGQIPAEFAGKTVALSYGNPAVDWTREPMVEGTIWQNNSPIGGLDWGHQYFRLAEKARGGDPIDLLIQTYAHNKETTVHRAEKPRTPEPEEFAGFILMVIDQERLDLFFDCEFAFQLMEAHEETDPIHGALLRTLNDVVNLIQGGSGKLSQAQKMVRDVLSSLSGELNHTITPLGHAHLDTAWLWPLRVTHLKMLHTTAVQLGMAERYPEYIFVHSQASQYEWLQNEAPILLDRVKKAIKKGNWEVVGSMWVEADCNLTGAESLIRQFLYGRRWFKQHLGVTTEDMWLPDVFGYSAALPQILSKFGIKYFLTQKLSWNQFNKIPHHTFMWEGIDGSQVWTHFPPADTYCASSDPKEIISSVKKYKDHARSDRSVYLFGFGDGGGGPTEWHIERIRRARMAPGLPLVEKKKKALDFFREASATGKDLQTWKGELYFELHRGTLTSQAFNKKANRESEFLLRDAELLAVFASGFPKSYPKEELEKAWKLVLLNQFHDIIPGSSVKEVYDDSRVDYAEVKKIGEKVINDSLKQIAKGLETSGFEQPVAIFHNATVPSQGEIPWTGDVAPACLETLDEVKPVQLIEEFGERKLIFETPAAALGTVAVADLNNQPCEPSTRLRASGRRLENEQWSVKFDNGGNIVSIQSMDDEPTEFIAPGGLGNMFQLFVDRPLFWDAWDVDAFSLEKPMDLARCDSFEIVEKGPVRAAVEIVKKFGNSTIRQRISLGPTPGIRFDTEIDWQESEKMLKVAFPMNIHSSRATFEIQFGSVERPTHRNTSWDMARFEVCAQKWFDLSEGGQGVALLNDGKYGCDVLNNVMRLTLLRSPKAPDPTCDMGVHRFTYVLLPHFDQVQHSDVVAAAYALNAPVRHAMLEKNGGQTAVLPQLISTDNRSLIVESVKKAEDSNRVIVRVYECHSTRGSSQLSCALPIKRAWLTDLNEDPIQELELDEGRVQFAYKPFEILTFMLEV